MECGQRMEAPSLKKVAVPVVTDWLKFAREIFVNFEANTRGYRHLDA